MRSRIARIARRVARGATASALVLLGLLLPPGPASPARGQGPVQDPVPHLSVALEALVQANEILGNPALGKDVAAIRAAVQQATPPAQTVRAQLEAARGVVGGGTLRFVQMALAELGSAGALGQLVLTGPADAVPVRHQELVVHGGAALAAINLALNTLGAGPSAPGAGRLLRCGARATRRRATPRRRARRRDSAAPPPVWYRLGRGDGQDDRRLGREVRQA
jgi:hypothetical protein